MKVTQIEVELEGLSDIMFDRFYDHSRNERPPEQKLYLDPGNLLVLPGENLESFLFGQDPRGCAKTFEKKAANDYVGMGMGHVMWKPNRIPFTRDGKPIVFKSFEDDLFYIHEGSGRCKGGGGKSIKQESKKRPVLTLPWSLAFTVSLVENALIDSQHLLNWFEQGGIRIALGTYRPRYGRFEVAGWEVNQ